RFGFFTACEAACNKPVVLAAIIVDHAPTRKSDSSGQACSQPLASALCLSLRFAVADGGETSKWQILAIRLNQVGLRCGAGCACRLHSVCDAMQRSSDGKQAIDHVCRLPVGIALGEISVSHRALAIESGFLESTMGLLSR